MASISPSALSTLKQCPLKFRLRYINGIFDTTPSIEATKGTVVHYILEKLFKQPPEKRIINKYWDTAVNAIVELQNTTDWTGEKMINYEFKTNSEKNDFTKEVIELLKTYFKNENPEKISVNATEKFLTLKLLDNLKLNGFADRLDGDSENITVVDYKTGKKPSERFSESVIFQMNIYALIIFSDTGKLPIKTKAIFLNPKENGIIENKVKEKKLIDVKKYILDCWEDINKRIKSDKWETKESKLCAWCDLQEYCPAFNNKTPETTPEQIEKYLK